MNWTVKHYHHNPKLNTTQTFSNRADAERAARNIQSDDRDERQCSIIEGPNGEYGQRTWNKRRIAWNKTRIT